MDMCLKSLISSWFFGFLYSLNGRVSGVLVELRVGGELGGGNGEDVEMLVEALSVVVTAFPGPEEV